MLINKSLQLNSSTDFLSAADEFLEGGELLPSLSLILRFHVWIDHKACHVAHILNGRNDLVIDNNQGYEHHHQGQEEGENVDEAPINHYSFLVDELFGQVQVDVHAFA